MAGFKPGDIEGYNNGMRTEKESFAAYYKFCLRTIKDMFGLNTKKYDIMKEKLDKCQNQTQLSNVMAYGRMNLL